MAGMGGESATFDRAVIFWLAAAIIFIFLVALLREILLPFVLGLVLAYFLDPVADWLERFGLSRLWATILILASFAVICLIILLTVVPVLINQLAVFATKVPGYVQTLRDIVNQFTDKWLGDLLSDRQLGFDQAFSEVGEKVAGWVGNVIRSVVSGGLALINFLSLILITPVVTFYLLRDWDHLIAQIDNYLPRDAAPTIRRLVGEINDVTEGFIRGQVTVLILLGTFYMIGLHLAGLNFGLLIGFGAGLISFIPFVGAIAGLVVAGGMAIVQFWPDWTAILIVFGIFFAGQFIEGNILSPWIVGDRVRLHPVWLIFALFVFGYLFGIVGLLLAVPLAAAIGVLMRFALSKYRESEIYQGDNGGEVVTNPNEKGSGE